MDLRVLKNFIDNNLLIHLDKLLNRPNIENGLIIESLKKITKRGDYGVATVDLSGSEVIKEDGNLEAYSPEGEQQNIFGFDAMWCVSENGVCNTIETVINYFIDLVNKGKASEEQKGIVKVFDAFGLIKDGKCKTDTAYVAVGSGTTKRGNSYQQVGNFIRKNGLVTKGMFPNYGKWKNWNDLYYGNYSEFEYSVGNKMPKDLLERGRKLVEYIDFSYAWYPKDSKEANRRGCPGTSIGAWSYPDNSGIYRPVGISINHAINRPKPVDSVRTIKDSYDPFTKKTSLDYPVGMDFLISIRLKKEIEPVNKEFFNYLKKERGKKLIQRTDSLNGGKGQVYELTDSGNVVELDEQAKKEKGIEGLAQRGDLVGISEADFKKLNNII